MSQKQQYVMLWSYETPYHFTRLPLTSASELRQMYQLINCELIDITKRKIGANYYDIIVDDEGLLKQEPIISLFRNKQPELVGHLIFTKYNEEGEQVGLLWEEVEQLKKDLFMVKYEYNGIVYKALAHES